MSNDINLKLSPKVLVAAMMGNCIEQYDFMLYVFLAPILAPIFFPVDDKIISLILSLSVYAIGFVARPLGAIYFGRIGDGEGRKKALSISIFGMALATAGMGLVPTYHQIGILAPILIIFLRLFQSFCVAGEYNGGAVYVLEQTPMHRQNLISGIYTSSGSLGSLLCSLTLATILNYQTQWESIWRLAFIFPAIFGLIGYYIRQSLPESLLKKDIKSSSLSLSDTFKHYPFELFMAFGIGSLSGCLFYFLSAFPNLFLPLVTTYTLHDISTSTSIILFCYIFNLWFMGYIADLIGSLKVMIFSILILILIGSILYTGIIANDIIYSRLCLILFSIFVSSFIAPSHVVMMKLFPANKRYTAISLTFNLGNGLLGATTSVITMTFYKITGNIFVPLLYLFFCSALFLIAFNLNTMRKANSLLLKENT